MTYTTINGNRLFHTDEGPGGDTPGETVLFVHGGTCDSHDWSAQIAAFAAHHRVIAPDLRGHGRSATPKPGSGSGSGSRSGSVSGLHPRDFAADLVELIAAVDAGPVVVVGHSLGAIAASVLAVEFPSLVRAVVAVDPPYGFEAEPIAQTAAAFHTADPIGVATTLLGGIEGPRTTPGTAALPVWHRRRILGMDPETVREIFLGLNEAATDLVVRPQVEKYLVRRACPVLTLSAANSLKIKGIDGHWDTSVSPHPYSASLVLEEVGHWFFQERPEEFNALVLGWIGGLTA
ncbi:alpha/beta hydrolase [Streptomyces sp. NBC_01485]|uniref:alpha/beta fold hydrolase n=1 Tax=Streptomyces sp. NBC_01485 TaxID=2903884 RepID=UPI002E36C451|nr:alpha/beta hydrolase [Streptomyces sp. NBC_01485]